MHPGVNTELSCAWLAQHRYGSDAGHAHGRRRFAAANASQIVIPADPDFDSASGTILLGCSTAPLPGPGNEGAMLFDRRTTNGTVIVMNSAGAIFWQGQSGSPNSFATGYVPDGNWHQVAVTYGQTTSDTISIYIDGVLSTANPVTNAWSWPTGQEIELGRSHHTYWQRYDGLMDDFRIYSRILTATEIATIFPAARWWTPGAEGPIQLHHCRHRPDRELAIWHAVEFSGPWPRPIGLRLAAPPLRTTRSCPQGRRCSSGPLRDLMR